VWLPVFLGIALDLLLQLPLIETLIQLFFYCCTTGADKSNCNHLQGLVGDGSRFYHDVDRSVFFGKKSWYYICFVVVLGIFWVAIIRYS